MCLINKPFWLSALGSYIGLYTDFPRSLSRYRPSCSIYLDFIIFLTAFTRRTVLRTDRRVKAFSRGRFRQCICSLSSRSSYLIHLLLWPIEAAVTVIHNKPLYSFLCVYKYNCLHFLCEVSNNYRIIL